MITTKCDDCQRQGLLGDVTDFPGYRVRSADPHAWLPLQCQGASHSTRFFPRQQHRGPDRVQKKGKRKVVAMSEENANLEIKSGPFLTLRTPSEMEVAPRYTLFSLFFWRDFGHVSILLIFGLFFQFSLVIKGKYVIHICSKWRKTNIPIIISKKFLKSVMWCGLESTPTFCIFQLLCFFYSTPMNNMM